MKCSKCGASLIPTATTCWSCGAKVTAPASTPNPASTPAPSPRQQRVVVSNENHVDTSNDFWMGFWTGPIGIICATIVDKRPGFWAGLRGAFIGVLVYVFIVVMIIETLGKVF